MFLVVFIDLLGFGIVLPLLPRYGEYFQASAATQGFLMASFSAMQFLFAPIWGRISDRVGRRPVLMVGLAGSVIFYALFGVASGLGPTERMLGLAPLAWLFVGRIGAGIAGATIPTAQAYIADVTDEQNRGKGMALIGAAFGLGFTLGPLMALTFAAGQTGAPPSPWAGYLASGLSAVALLGAIFLLPESLTPDRQAPHREWMRLSSLGKVLHSPVHAGIVGGIFLATFAFAQFESTLSLLTKHLGFSDRQNSYVFAYLGFMLIVFQGLLVRRLMPVVRERRMAIAGAVLLMIGMLLVAWSAGTARDAEAAALAAGSQEAASNDVKTALLQLLLVLPAAVAGFSALNPALQSMLSLNTSAVEQGEILGLAQSMSSLARILGPFLGIMIFYRLGEPAPYWSAAAMMLVAALWIGALRTGASGVAAGDA